MTYTEVLSAHEFVLDDGYQAAEHVKAVYKQPLSAGFSLLAFVADDAIQLVFAHENLEPGEDGRVNNVGDFDIDVDYDTLDAAVVAAHRSFYTLRDINKILA